MEEAGEGATMREMSLRRTDLPIPEGPRMHKIVAGGSEREMAGRIGRVGVERA